MSDTESQPSEQPNLASSSSAGSPSTTRRRRSSSLTSSAPATPERRTSRRERLSGRGFLPPSSGGSFDDEALDDEADATATADVLLDLGRRLSWFFGANLAINLPLKLVFLRQAARPLGSPQHSLSTEVKLLLPSSGPVSVAGGLPSNTSWKYILGTTALIGLSEVSAGIFAGITTMYFDSGHIPSLDEWHDHEKPTFYGISRKQLASFAGKLLTGAFFYPFFSVMPILLATHRWPGLSQFFSDMTHNRNGFWNGLLLNVIKYSIIDLAPFLEDKLYHKLKLVPEEEEEEEGEWEPEPFFSVKHLEKYGLSLTATVLASLLYVPIDVLTTQMVVYPTQYMGALDCVKQVWRTEGLKGLYRGFWANLLSEQELLFI